jgi:ribose 5-phosphate isomerase A
LEREKVWTGGPNSEERSDLLVPARAAPSNIGRVPLRAVSVEDYKRAAAEEAAQLVEDGMRVGLGTGTTVAHLLPALAARGLRDLRCVATSSATEQQALALGLPVEPFSDLDALDIAIDGADQVAPDHWVMKGGGGAHTREKIVAAAAARFVVIVSDDKLVPALQPPVPLELMRYGALATLRALPEAELRDIAPSPDDGLIADYHGPVGNPAVLADRLVGVPGVIEHGLFPPDLVSEVIAAGSAGVRRA